MHHELKILPCYFRAIVDGGKKFEIRNNADRGFQKGDTVSLEEIEKGEVFDEKTGNKVLVRITYVTDYNQPPNQVVFGFEVVQVIEI